VSGGTISKAAVSMYLSHDDAQGGSWVGQIQTSLSAAHETVETAGQRSAQIEEHSTEPWKVLSVWTVCHSGRQGGGVPLQAIVR
jgi:predicted transcriptional regulator